MRIVGTKNRSEIELDPAKAYQRARAHDAILRSVMPPIVHGVTRGTHEFFNCPDDERQTQAARALNGLIKTKTDYREKDVLDKQVLTRIKQSLGGK